MKSLRARALAIAVAAAATPLLVPAVSSAAGVQSGGGPLFLGPPTVLVFEPVGPNNFYTVQQGVLSLNGTVTGAGTITVTEKIHAKQGFSNLTATWECDSCTVNGTTGDISGKFVGKDDEVTFGGTFVMDGSGALAGFHGNGTFGGSDRDGSGSYTLNYH